MIPELRTLIAVARHGTFAAAGHRIGLTQAAVSGHIRRLEERLGFALFERTGRSAVLNTAGLRTLARAEEIVGRFNALAENASDEEEQGLLKIGAIASSQPTLLARALVPFRVRFPRCRVHVSPGVSLHLMDRVDAGELDLAVLIRPPFDPLGGMVWQPLIREEYALLTRSDVDADDWQALVAGESFIQYDRSSFGGRQVERFLKKNGLRPSAWLEVDDIHAMVAMVENGLGIAIAPLTEVILPLPRTVRANPLESESIYREIGIFRRKPAISPLAAFFSQYLQEQAVR